ncbi:MAG: hypothetical protein HY959_01745 [Ignavibacteriae bacterium]|nr:hypothetical protein [Ignavibacteriota bacterium]
MKPEKYITYIFGIFLIFALAYISACDSKGGSTESVIVNPPPPPPNPYGEGNGKISFIRTQQIDGSVIIYISNKQINDTIVWNVSPSCDTNIITSQILKAGNYSVRIEGNIFLCNYNVNVEERKCKILDYTNCSGGYVGCYTLDGVWNRTADGPCPNCRGLKIEFRNGVGEVIYTPPGCRFPIGDLKWIDFDINGCNISDLARDSLGGGPEYQRASMTFENKNSLIINGPSGTIPYSRISTDEAKKILKNIKRTDNSGAPAKSTGLQTAG